MAIVREFLMMVKESANKVPKTSPVVWTTSTPYGIANADAYYNSLSQSNAFTLRARSTGNVTTPYGGGFDFPRCTVSDKQECRGRLTTIATVSQLPFLLSWAGVRINGAQTSPWTTTELPGDLASVACYHGIVRSDGSIKRRVYLGCKVDAWTLSVSEASTVATLSLDISGTVAQGNTFDGSVDPDATIFPSPSDNNFSCDPYMFIYAGGSNFLTFGGAVRTELTEITITATNTLARHWYPTSHFVPQLRLMGRRVTTSTRLLYKPTPDDRTAYETLATHSVSIQMSNGVHGFTIDLGSQNIFNPLDDDLPMNDFYFQPATEMTHYDPSVGTDMTITFT